MTGRERVELAFAHREPDRVPGFEQAFASDVASALLGREAATGATLLFYQEAAAWADGDECHAEFEHRCYHDLIDLARLLQHDVILPPWRHAARPTRRLSEYEFLYGDADGVHELWRYNPDAKTFYRAGPPPPAPTDLDPDTLVAAVEGLERAAEVAVVPSIPATDWHRRFRADCPDLAVFAPGGLAVPLQPIWLMACRLRPDLVVRYLEALVELGLKHAAAWAGLGFTVVWGGGDLADNHGPTYGPQVFHDLVLPSVRRYVDGLHALGLQYVYRTDGNLWSIADDFFVHSAIDGYGEIDCDSGMAIPDLQARFGDRVTFWGDVPCGSLLHRGRAADVREFVRRRLETCRGQGGWLLGSSNSIVPGTPPENVLAMYEEVGRG